jgi:ferredoxin
MGCFRVKVDMQLCQGHGECAEEAPEVFDVNYDASVYPKVKVLKARLDESLREQVESAVKYCPNHVISIVEIDD